MATFILVHGAFQGSFVWKETAALLESQGHETLAPGLTGLGDRSHLLAEGQSLAGYVDDVQNAVAFAMAGPCVFVGHSYSGLTATAAAARLPRLARAVLYVDALIPEPGRSFRDMAGPEFAKTLAAHVHDRWLVRPWPLAAFGVAGHAKAPAFAARLTSTPLAAFTDPFAFGLPDPALPAGFIRCTGNPNPFIEAQAAKARASGWPVTLLDSGHAPMITAPEALARAILTTAHLMGVLGDAAPAPAPTLPEGLLRTHPAQPGELPGGAS
ncbi:hypothetical protein NNJEOMEG_02549 [Fundidesulfovibrio magnetotacticus]|uniref:AB hydrolase-1 domain-containing protein n=1 Tax=Fundidesulfovibrio magnetotacticus TaxID=2730080 RepID=A0A6V8LQ91_9BACT|nr:alpha/beta hydrolase [Fundidesulfovibrio magnetotacticus]GFK94702.1 hypothetical protein NNJEOMEG_02549 [Fundidesulfovibrio magnetotacticus]